MTRFAKSIYFLPAAAHYGFIFFLSSQSSFPVEAPFDNFDKLVHLGLFTVLSFLLSFGIFKSTRFPMGKKIVLILAAGAALGALDEVHQSFVPFREPDVLDAAVDAVGIALGLFAYWVIWQAQVKNARAKAVKGRAFAAEVDPRAKPGALTRDVNTRLSTAETDPQTKPGAPAATPAAVDRRDDKKSIPRDP